MSVFLPFLRVAALAVAVTLAVVTIGTGGCSNSSTPQPTQTTSSPSPGVSPSPTASVSPQPSPQNFISMTYTHASPTPDPIYGQVDGYALLKAAPAAASTPGASSIINLLAGQTVQFFNFDTVLSHSASLLGPAGFPPTFTNANGPIGSPPGTAISAPQFSTGALGLASASGPAGSSIYATGGPGVFYFGDFSNYVPIQPPSAPSMRTVIIVH